MPTEHALIRPGTPGDECAVETAMAQAFFPGHDPALLDPGRVQALDAAFITCEYDRDCQVVQANDNFLSLFSPDALGQDFSQPSVPGFAPGKNSGNAVAAIRLGRRHRCLVEMAKANGDTVWLESVFIPLPLGSVKPDRVWHIALDVSDKSSRETALQENLDRVTTILEQAWMAVGVTNAEGRTVYINDGFTRMFGYSADEFLGRNMAELFGSRGDAISESLFDQLGSGEPLNYEMSVQSKHGHQLWVSVTLNPVMNAEGGLKTVIAVFADITETKIRESFKDIVVTAMLREAGPSETASLLCIEVEKMLPGVVVSAMGVEKDRVYPLGTPSLPESCRQIFLDPIPDSGASPSQRAALTGEVVRVLDMDADPGAEMMTPFREFGLKSGWSTPIRDSSDQVIGVVSFCSFEHKSPDPFEERVCQMLVNVLSVVIQHGRAQASLRRIANYDYITGLPNRDLLTSKADRVLSNCGDREYPVPVAVLRLGLNHFRDVAGSLGHDGGNHLLGIVARRLEEKRYPLDIVGKIGTDEFALVLPDCDADKARLVAEQTLTAIRQKCRVDGVEMVPSVSIGISLYPENGDDMETLLNNAGAALAAAPDEGGFSFFSAKHNATARRDLSLEACLRSAIGKNELHLYYQPQVSFADGSLHGVEALARWVSREYGPIGPDKFIPLAEEAGIINELSEWVVNEACFQLGAWRRNGFNVPRVSVNLSAVNFKAPDLPYRLTSCLEKHDLQPSDMVLEITENVFLDSDSVTIETIAKTDELGFNLSLDDFGTGYSSLGYLRRLPISEIKLDRSFVRDLVTDPVSRGLSEAIIHLGKNLNLLVVVEGVEMEDQYQLLKNQGFHIMQGYLVSKPMAPGELEEWLHELHGKRPNNSATKWRSHSRRGEPGLN
ncbi:MAG: EAL domain-containing protein [Planctomycetes bacterium]|nr:EAL domain-containing protein [Planctomycetota bacterium]